MTSDGDERREAPPEPEPPEQNPPGPARTETEIYITRDGQVLVTDLTPDLLALLQSLAPDDPRLQRLRQILAEQEEPKSAEPQSPRDEQQP